MALAVLLLASGCPKQPQLEMEAPGRPAVTWQNETGDAAPVPDVQAQKEAERELLAELRESERKGSDDLALADTLYNLAILRRQQGEFAEADGLYRRALEIRERKEGPNHPDVAATLNNLAGLEAAQGDYDAAQPLLERALSIRQAALGNNDVLTVQSMNNLALLYAAQGNAAAAEPLYQRAVSILEKTDSARKTDLDRVLDNYAALLHDIGRDPEADALEARARLIRANGAAQPQSP
jgi:tetratricopeptide (TPR) repeat protein